MLGVILVHYYVSPNPVLTNIATVGSRCPQLFFIASAFLTWKVIDRNNGAVDFKMFYKKRGLRIAPIYWLALFVALLLPIVSFQQHSVGDILSHIIFLNGLVPQWTNNIMHVEWYITDLAILYLCCLLLRRVAYNLRSSICTLFIVVLLSSVLLIATNNQFATQILSDSSWEMYFHTFFFLNQLPVWMLGVVIYYWMKEHEIMSWGGIIVSRSSDDYNCSICNFRFK